MLKFSNHDLIKLQDRSKEGNDMKNLVDVADKYKSEKEIATMKKSFRNNRLKSLKKGKARALGIFEILSMKFAGWTDGRKGLLRKGEDGSWQSSRLKEEIDTYEEFCEDLYGHLKFEEEEEFKKLNALLDSVVIQNKDLSVAQKNLDSVLNKDFSVNKRKVGEESLSEVQVIARRNHERNKQLRPYYNEVEEKRITLSQTVEEIYKRLSHVRESFDSTCKIAHRLHQHCQRRIDVYWRSAMRQNGELPPVPRISFTNYSELDYRNHFEKLEKRAEQLRNRLALEG